MHSANKSFNLAGFHTHYIRTKNIDLKNKIKEKLDKYSLNNVDALSIQALISSYDKEDVWLKELIFYIKDNLDYMSKNLNKKITFIKPEGTYLVFLNCKNLDYTHKEMQNILLKKCKLILNRGTEFGDKKELFFRLNLATNRENIKKAVDRLNAICEL